jgi:hypothetical protein
MGVLERSTRMDIPRLYTPYSNCVNAYIAVNDNEWGVLYCGYLFTLI